MIIMTLFYFQEVFYSASYSFSLNPYYLLKDLKWRKVCNNSSRGDLVVICLAVLVIIKTLFYF